MMDTAGRSEVLRCDIAPAARTAATGRSRLYKVSLTIYLKDPQASPAVTARWAHSRIPYPRHVRGLFAVAKSRFMAHACDIAPAALTADSDRIQLTEAVLSFISKDY